MLKAQVVVVAILAGQVALASAGPAEMWSSGQDATVYYSGPAFDFPNARAARARSGPAEMWSRGQDFTVYYSGPTTAFPNARAGLASAGPAEMWSSGQDSTVNYSTAPIVAAGTVVGINGAAKSVRLEHGSIRMINHPPMTMEVAVRDANLLSGLQTGRPIVFELIEQNGQFVMAKVR
jgi:Cu/Ag efflux protein CusF